MQTMSAAGCRGVSPSGGRWHEVPEGLTDRAQPPASLKVSKKSLKSIPNIGELSFEVFEVLFKGLLLLFKLLSALGGEEGLVELCLHL